MQCNICAGACASFMTGHPNSDHEASCLWTPEQKLSQHREGVKGQQQQSVDDLRKIMKDINVQHQRQSLHRDCADDETIPFLQGLLMAHHTKLEQQKTTWHVCTTRRTHCVCLFLYPMQTKYLYISRWRCGLNSILDYDKVVVRGNHVARFIWLC